MTGVVIVEEAVDGGLQIEHGLEDAALETALGEGREEALDGVEPGARGRREVVCSARMARQPFSDLGVLVVGVVVEDRMDGLAGGDLALDSVEETDELLMPMALHVAADHGSVEPVHRRKQRRRAIALVVMGHRSRPALLHRQAGLGSVERLDLALLVDGKDNSVRRRIDIEPGHVAQLVDERGSLESLDCMRCG